MHRLETGGKVVQWLKSGVKSCRGWITEGGESCSGRELEVNHADIGN